MARRNRKRGRNSRNEVPGNINININIPSTSTTADEAEVSTNPVTQTTNQETSIRRQGGGRPNYHVEEPKTDLGPSPERLSSRFSNPSNGCGDTVEFNISNARHAAEVAQGTVEAVKVVPPMDAVVKVICAHAEPNFSLPWQRKHQPSSTSSGFIIKNQRVLTNAHSVEHYTQVKLKKRGSDTKYLATVLAIGTECDIAMLTVRDDEFWEGVSPVEFGDLPTLLDAVTVVGYPIGGETISVTSGVVSRIEMVSYVHGSAELLGLQIDAAINSGNSGGPAFSDKGKCVGIAFQSLGSEDVENISYLISTPVIKHFLQDYEKNEEYTGFPVLAVEWQPMENPDLRKLMGMEPDQKGVLIRRVEPTGPQSRDLKPLDVILSFDGVNIANDGTVRFGNGECISFSYLVSQKYIGDNAVVKILRNSDTLELDTELGNHTRLIPANIKGDPPYYIIGGFVFTAVSVPYLCSKYGKDFDSNAPAGLMDKHLRGMAQSKDEEVVVVSQVLDADVNIGYAGIVNTQVIAFNGKPVKNLKTLAGMVETCNEEFLKFVLDYDQVSFSMSPFCMLVQTPDNQHHPLPRAGPPNSFLSARLWSSRLKKQKRQLEIFLQRTVYLQLCLMILCQEMRMEVKHEKGVKTLHPIISAVFLSHTNIHIYMHRHLFLSVNHSLMKS